MVMGVGSGRQQRHQPDDLSYAQPCRSCRLLAQDSWAGERKRSSLLRVGVLLTVL